MGPDGILTVMEPDPKYIKRATEWIWRWRLTMGDNMKDLASEFQFVANEVTAVPVPPTQMCWVSEEKYDLETGSLMMRIEDLEHLLTSAESVGRRKAANYMIECGYEKAAADLFGVPREKDKSK